MKFFQSIKSSIYSHSNEPNNEGSNIFVLLVERFLTWKKRRRYIQKERQKRKNFIEDWGGAILWAAFIVLLINQYFFQAYKIPSGSMINTLEIGDMLFVNKMIYGPELLPGYFKISSPIEPKRGDVIIFESPEYEKNSVVKELINRLVYMVSFSLINLDKSKDGKEAVHFLVKRAIGIEGDFIKFEDNNMLIAPAGLFMPFKEEELFLQLKAHNNTNYNIASVAGYDLYRNHNFVQSYNFFIHNPVVATARYDSIYPSYSLTAFDISNDPQFIEGVSILHNPRYMAMRDNYGFYVSKDYILPLGDNRNNSHDGRSWGPVHKDKVLGKVAIRYWPINGVGVPK